jgi:non-heme Fe2+,alpha-ketoglutarate-dependent halogenase
MAALSARFFAEVYTTQSPVLAQHPDYPEQRGGLLNVRDRHLDSRLVYDMCTHPAIVNCVEKLLSPNLLLWRSQFFVQEAGSGRLSAWHQDKDYSGLYKIPSTRAPDGGIGRTVSAWLALEDATIENGCVQIVRGSHALGVIPDRPVQNRDQEMYNKGLELQLDIDPTDIVPMQTNQGSFFVFNEMTVHGSVPNLGTRRRVGLSIRFSPSETRIYPSESTVNGQGMNVERFGSILVRGVALNQANRIVEPPNA